MFFVARALCVLALVLGYCLIPASADAEDFPIGTVVGQIYSTDILAYIDGYPIPSYNVDGRTVVSLRALRDYGFDVRWDEGARTVSVHPQAIPVQAPEIDLQPQRPGTPLGPVYATDIHVEFYGFTRTAYNIGGETVIALAELAKDDVPPEAYPFPTDLNRAIGYSNAGVRLNWDPAARAAHLEVLRPGKMLALHGAEYPITGLVYSHNEIGGSVYRVIPGEYPVIATGDFLRIGSPLDRYCDSAIMDFLLDDSRTLEDGTLSFSYWYDAPDILFELQTDADLSKSLISFGPTPTGINLSNSYVILPVISIPVRIERHGDTTRHEATAIIWDGEFFYDALPLLSLKGRLIP